MLKFMPASTRSAVVGCTGSDVARLSIGLLSVACVVVILSKDLESGVSFDFERSEKFERTLLAVVYADEEEIEVVKDAEVTVEDEDENMLLRLLLLVVELSDV